MYDKIIEALAPIPKLNLTWYQNQDLYSEGDIEDTIIQLIAQNQPENYVSAIYQNFSWSTYYHLTHLRKNILNWYPFSKDATVLEIGCGMGAITGVLCDNCKEVTSVELSKRRAIATLLRCREKENLEIIVGNLNDIPFDKKFDYITLIGVLEYQGSYTDTTNPYKDFLQKIKGLLAPNGKLLIAIENQYGLKYWCGAPEDHTGLPFDGIHQYSLSEKKVHTFSKYDLENLIKSSGFKNTYFYYPMPDYKLPTVIYSQNKLPTNAKMQNVNFYYTNNSTLIAQEETLYKDIINNNTFEFFANSFLVECTDDEQYGKVTFASLNSERFPEQRICTRFTQDNAVEKFSLSGDIGLNHISQIHQNETELSKHSIKIWESTLINNIMTSQYTTAPLFESIVLEAFAANDTDKIFSLFDLVYTDILKSSDLVDWKQNILYSFDLDIEPDQEKYGPILKTGYLDMLFRNAFYINNSPYWFDQEWILENVPAKYVFYRTITQFYAAYPEVNSILPVTTIIQHYQLLNIWNELRLLDELFMGAVIDQEHRAASNILRDSNCNTCINNIQKILAP